MFKHLTGSEVSTRRVPLSRLPGGNEKWIPGFWLAVLVLVSPSHGGSVNNRDLVNNPNPGDTPAIPHLLLLTVEAELQMDPQERDNTTGTDDNTENNKLIYVFDN